MSNWRNWQRPSIESQGHAGSRSSSSYLETWRPCIDRPEGSDYYAGVWGSVEPSTRSPEPLKYITVQGWLTLYAGRNCTDQLAKGHKISLSVDDGARGSRHVASAGLRAQAMATGRQG